jgi:hypothetical protein
MASSVITHSFKAKNEKEKLRLNSRVFYEKPGTFTSGSIASERIGLTTLRESATSTEVITDDTIGGTKEGPVTILGNDLTNNISFFRYGKDVKSVKNLLNDKLTPNITLGRENDITSDNHLDHGLELCFYGQNSFFKTYDYENERLIPFDDIEGKPEAKSFIGKTDAEKTGYPYVYDTRRNYDKFRDPDEASLDGAIEVFNVRSSPINTGFLDLQIKGARGLFGVGNWELTQHTTAGKKGSPLVSERFEIKQSSYDFFEDAAESILNLSIEGYISDGLYKSSPFVEKIDYLNSEYEHLSPTQKTDLLAISSRDDSELGTRFKSRDNGIIITPFYKLTEQRCFGTDSIAFRGLLKG